MLHLSILAALLASSATALNINDPSVASTVGAQAPTPAAAPPPAPTGQQPLSCTTYQTKTCSGGSAAHNNMVVGQNIPSPNMNSIQCNRILIDHEQIDLSTYSGKRDVEANANASEPLVGGEDGVVWEKRDDSCSKYIYSIHGLTTQCIPYPQTANCLNLRRDDW